MIYEIIIETKDGDVRRVERKTKDKAIQECERYCRDYRVMINELDEEYGTCKNIFDNKAVIDALDDMEKEMWRIITETYDRSPEESNR